MFFVAFHEPKRTCAKTKRRFQRALFNLAAKKTRISTGTGRLKLSKDAAWRNSKVLSVLSLTLLPRRHVYRQELVGSNFQRTQQRSLECALFNLAAEKACMSTRSGRIKVVRTQQWSLRCQVVLYFVMNILMEVDLKMTQACQLQTTSLVQMTSLRCR